MSQSQQVEELICLVSSLDREALVHQFANYQATFPVDFTKEFLSSTPLDRLRHIFVAMCLQSRHIPESSDVQVA